MQPNLNNNAIESKFQTAFELHSNGMLEDAAKLYAEILSINPAHFDSLHLSGLLAAQKDQLQVALELMTRAIEIKSTEGFAHKNLGVVLHHLERYDDAILSYQKALLIDPSDSEALYSMGNAYFSQLMYEEAISKYKDALKLNPDLLSAHLNMGIALYELGFYDSAVVCFDAALELSPDYAEAFYNRGMALEGMGERDRACVDYERAMIFEPNHQGAKMRFLQIQGL